MKCPILFSGNSKKTITNLSSAELAKRAVMVNSFSVHRAVSRICLPGVYIAGFGFIRNWYF